MTDINNIEVQRGSNEYIKYCRDKSVIKSSNFFIATDENGNDENIKSVKDLSKSIISKEQYEIKWNNRCENYFNSLKNV